MRDRGPGCNGPCTPGGGRGRAAFFFYLSSVDPIFAQFFSGIFFSQEVHMENLSSPVLTNALLFLILMVLVLIGERLSKLS